MKTLKITTDNKISVVDVNFSDFKAIQQAIGGYFEIVNTQKLRDYFKASVVEPSNQIVRDKNNSEIQLAATLFYDCRNSQPIGINFKVDQIIDFNGQKHQIKTIEPLYDNLKLHHYEIGMVRYGKN